MPTWMSGMLCIGIRKNNENSHSPVIMLCKCLFIPNSYGHNGGKVTLNTFAKFIHHPFADFVFVGYIVLA